MDQRDDDPGDPVVDLARDYVRTFGGEGALQRFDAALEEHGIRRALEEAAVGIGAGLLRQQLRGQRQGQDQGAAPNVDEVPLPEDRPRTGTALRIVDDGHGDLDVREPRGHEKESSIDGAVMIETEGDTYFWDVGFDYGELELLSEPKNGVAHVAVLEAVQEAEIVAIEDADNQGESSADGSFEDLNNEDDQGAQA